MHEVTFSIGATVSAPFCPASRVVGVDSYVLKAFDGSIRRWDSYTLVSDTAGAFARWWIANVPLHGAHYFIGGDVVPSDAVFDPAQSGLVALASEGDAALSSACGALVVYRTDDGTFYSQEVFDGAERLVFIGRPFQP